MMQKSAPYATFDWMLALAVTYAVIAWTMVCFAIGLLLSGGGPS